MTRVMLVLVLALPLASQTPNAAPCAPPDRPGRVVNVDSVETLERAVATARPGDTISIADGRYRLRRALDVATPDVTLRGRSGDRDRVVLHGGGMTSDDVGVVLSISAAGITIADVTLRDVRHHAIQVRGERGASRFSLYRSALVDAGQQLLKASVARGPEYADDGLVACSFFAFTTTAPSDYTNAIDLLATRGWTIRDSRFERIRGPASGGYAAMPAILAWMAAAGTVIERNIVIDSFRGIGLGLTASISDLARGGERTYDHFGGLIRNNVVVNLHSWAEEGIEVTAARGVTIEHNTVVVEGRLPWSIGVRYPTSSATVRNNLTSRRVLLRDGGTAVIEGHVTGAAPGWFADAAAGNLRLRPGTAAAGAGVLLAEPGEDFDRRPRPADARPDAGAFQSTSRGSR